MYGTARSSTASRPMRPVSEGTSGSAAYRFRRELYPEAIRHQPAAAARTARIQRVSGVGRATANAASAAAWGRRGTRNRAAWEDAAQSTKYAAANAPRARTRAGSVRCSRSGGTRTSGKGLNPMEPKSDVSVVNSAGNRSQEAASPRGIPNLKLSAIHKAWRDASQPRPPSTGEKKGYRGFPVIAQC